jgi:hypothetical protein
VFCVSGKSGNAQNEEKLINKDRIEPTCKLNVKIACNWHNGLSSPTPNYMCVCVYIYIYIKLTYS